jgi:outer membrane protein OmpA-like peptidoglycan-associated protein
MSRLRIRLSAGAAVVALALVSACGAGGGSADGAGGDASAPQTPKAPVKVAGSVVSTATSSNEAEIVVPDPVSAAWSALGGKGSGVEWVAVAGDGSTATAEVDLAGNPEAGQQLASDMNGRAAETDGRSALAGLEAVESPAGSPVWVFSPLLDTSGPLDFEQLAFDTSPPTVVKSVKKAGALPTLKGRDVTFVVTPAAGEQRKLSKLQVGYQRAVWEGVARAAGAKRVTFFEGTGTTAGTGTITPVPVPDPNDKISSVGQGRTRTCTLPAPALFVADQPTLIDKAATRRQLKECVGTLDAKTTITVEGHTAGVDGADNEFTKNLSTQRATEVAALLRELDVPARSLVKVVGYGSSRPLVKPASNPKNRAVVVTFTSPA